MIEVSGVRRSWEIERSRAVFSSSLRRSASASTASACIRSRSRVSASSSAQSAIGFLAATLGLDRASTRQAGDGAADDRRDHERGQGNPVLLLGDREAMQRWDLEEVEGGGAGNRGEQSQPQPPHDRDQQDRRQVDDPERDDRRHLLERVDEQRSRGDSDKRCRNPSQAAGGSAPKAIIENGDRRIRFSVCLDPPVFSSRLAATWQRLPRLDPTLPSEAGTVEWRADAATLAAPRLHPLLHRDSRDQ